MGGSNPSGPHVRAHPGSKLAQAKLAYVLKVKTGFASIVGRAASIVGRAARIVGRAVWIFFRIVATILF